MHFQIFHNTTIVIQQIQNLRYDVKIHICICIHTPLAFNTLMWGSLRLAPIIAKRLSARLQILQCVFWVGGVWPQLPSRFRNAICHASGMQARVWLVRKHPSRLGMQLKVSVYKKCVHVRKFVVPSAVAALAVSLSKSCDESEEERARRLTRKRKRRQRDKR